MLHNFTFWGKNIMDCMGKWYLFFEWNIFASTVRLASMELSLKVQTVRDYSLEANSLCHVMWAVRVITDQQTEGRMLPMIMTATLRRPTLVPFFLWVYDQDLTNTMVKSSPKSAWSNNQPLTKIRPSILGKGSESCITYQLSPIKLVTRNICCNKSTYRIFT